jgi:membrane-bound ClpP family serine protease
VGRYVLFQLPGLAGLALILILVQRWVNLHAWLVWGLVGLWVTKDVIMFPFVWRAYDQSKHPVAPHLMVGAGGIAEDQLAPSGYVRVRGELWQAEVVGGGPPIDRGKGVWVRGIHGLTLLVQPDNQNSTE